VFSQLGQVNPIWTEVRPAFYQYKLFRPDTPGRGSYGQKVAVARKVHAGQNNAATGRSAYLCCFPARSKPFWLLLLLFFLQSSSRAEDYGYHSCHHKGQNLYPARTSSREEKHQRKQLSHSHYFLKFRPGFYSV